jgi:hypothetical protein
MKDHLKNIVALVIITIAVVLITHYLNIGGGLFWMIMMLCITIWLMITPFKLYDDEA